MNFYTYAHYKVSDGSPFYVGKGKDLRAFDVKGRSPHWVNIKNKHGHKVEILAYWETEEECFIHEKFIISCFKSMGHALCNKTDGGEGSSGLKWSEESKLRVTGHTRHKSEESRRKISETTRAAMKRPEVKAKLGLHSVGKKFSSETRAKMSESHKNRMTPENIEFMKSISEKSRTSESLLKMSKALTGIKRVKVKCPHCGATGANNTMTRWHFENCKLKGSE